MGTITRFEDIEAWQTALELAREVYRLSAMGMFAKDFGLRDQMRRAAVSVMSNVAEGYESRTQALFVDYLGRAKGSAGEVRAQLYVALDAGYVTEAEFDRLTDLSTKASRQISRFMDYLESHPPSRTLRDSGAAYDAER